MHYEQLDSNRSDEVVQLFYDTFETSENEEEARAVSGLVLKYLENYPRADLKGFVALESEGVVGCLFFSELVYAESDKKVFILSPMAVKTELQGKGVGKALIRFAHEKLKDEGVNMVTTYGDINFYGKSGYALISEDQLAAPLPLSYPEGWLGFALDGQRALKVEGPSTCIPELNDQALW